MKLLILSLLALTSLSLLVQATRTFTAGGWSPIKDLTDPHVTEIATFAISTHNDAAKESLVFVKVVKGATQVVSGINYKLVVVANGTGGTDDYTAVVWEKPNGSKQLTSFYVTN